VVLKNISTNKDLTRYISLKMKLVTNNAKEFKRINELKTEDWTK